ncbi:hypothetical protein [Actinomadura sp. 6K520]|uniref:hypothetical protein n=1 Tax=Actinomadura sp. 6K520 TaxID=2530364 RepID=UPI00104506C1|nr:hypothetical protein [Actinomadura sp. 6K520]TDE22953.1 hypothetical protein E1289_28945 [Actinomadura sp. 6K520]
MTTPDGEPVEIDELMVPVIARLWQLGYATLLSCQDGGEATLAGSTGAEPDQVDRLARLNAGRAWVTVREDAAPVLLAVLDGVEAVRSNRAKAEGWVSISWPTEAIEQVIELLRH